MTKPAIHAMAGFVVCAPAARMAGDCEAFQDQVLT
jgi:hypothetical protein